jgi:hypothetical protein
MKSKLEQNDEQLRAMQEQLASVFRVMAVED